MLRMKPWLCLLALGLAGCGRLGGEEPLYVLRDSLGRSVALAGSSQLGGVAPGSVVRVPLDGLDQDLMVGERVGQGPILAARPADAPPPNAVQSLAPEAVSVGADAMPSDPAAPVPVTTSRGARGTGAAAREAGANPSGRRRGPSSRAVARSVM